MIIRSLCRSCIRAVVVTKYASRFINVSTANRCLSTSSPIWHEKDTSPDADDRAADSTKHATNSVDPSEVDKFSRIAEQWWTSGGEFDALHSLNELRVPLVRDGLLRLDSVNTAQGTASSAEGTSTTVGMARSKRRPNPLTGYRVLDVGCGGGILSEPIARLGADVTGLDASAENVAMAEWHAKQDPRLTERLTYTCCGVEDLSDSQAGLYDGVVASEVLEHVSNPQEFVAACCRLVKEEGSLFFTTLNKTRLSHALAVVAAEQLLRIVPAGAHDWDKFIPPETLQAWLEDCGFRVLLVHGMLLNPLTTRWSWVSNTSINYAMHAVKLAS